MSKLRQKNFHWLIERFCIKFVY